MSLSLTVKIDTAKLLAALQAAPRAVSRELRIAQGKAMAPVQKEARSKAGHRYTTRSGAAEAATGDKGPTIAKYGLSSTLALEPGIAIYINRLHEGWGKRPPDRFLYRAFDRHENNIVMELEAGLRKGLAKAGL